MTLRRITTLLALSVFALLVHAAAASASLGVIGSFGGGGGIAVDPITGDVYQAEPGGNRVVKYDASGNFILTFGKEVNKTAVEESATRSSEEDVCPAPGHPADVCQPGVAGEAAGQLDLPAGVAVDPTSGDVYVNASGNKTFHDNRIERFSSAGIYLSQIVGGQNGAPEFALTASYSGLAVDTEGYLYAVSAYGGAEVLKFTSIGEYTGQSFVPPSGGGWQWTFPTDVAVDPSGNVYVTQSFGDPVVKFSPSGAAFGALPCKNHTNRTLAVNLYSGEVFLSGEEGGGNYTQPYICRYDSSGSKTEEFEAAKGPGDLGELAYGTGAGRLYEAGGSVVIYGTFPTPPQGAATVSREDWSEPGLHTITVSGYVNPDSLPTTYQFEYSSDPGLAAAEEAPVSPGDAGESFLPFKQSVELSGLQPSTTYYYRLVAHNSFGGGAGSTTDGPIQTFTTLAPLPTATTGAATEIGGDSATVAGTVVPGSNGAASDTKWCFEYGSTDEAGYNLGYTPGAPAGDAGQGTSPVAVSADLSRLWPETTYRYRLIAVNSLGSRLSSHACGTEGGQEADGAEGTFTTASSGRPPLATSGSPVVLSANAATLTGTVDPRGTPTTYHFQFGTEAGSGVSLFGDAGSGSESQPVRVDVASLQPATTYHYRLIAANRYGTSYGEDESFITPAVSGSAFPTSPPPPRTCATDASLCPSPPSLRCRKGFVKRTVSGKPTCVKVRRHHKHRKHH